MRVYKATAAACVCVGVGVRGVWVCLVECVSACLRLHYYNDDDGSGTCLATHIVATLTQLQQKRKILLRRGNEVFYLKRIVSLLW